MARSRDRDYDYGAPSYEDTVQRAERQGSMYDSVLKDAKVLKAEVGVNLVRILPAGWPKAKHFGYWIRVHRNVGPKDRQYLCNLENPDSPYDRCPICEELHRLGRSATSEDKRDLLPSDTILYYVIDRNNEKEGVQVWSASGKTDSEIAAQSVNHRTKSVLNIAHPDNGYDVEFTRKGTGRNNTRYFGFKVDRDSTPLSDSDKRYDAWLDYVFDKPLPKILNFYSPDYIEKIFFGQDTKDEKTPSSRVRDEDEQEERGSRLERRRSDDDEDRPSRSRSRSSEDEEETSRRTRREEPEEERSSRSRRGEEDETPRRSRREESEEEEKPRSRRGEDDDEPRRTRNREEEDETPRRRAGGREEEEETPSRSRRRTVAEDLDDEIPSDGGRRARANGRDEEAEQPARRTRARLDDDDEKPREERTRSRRNEDEDEPPRRTQREKDPEEDEERSSRSRSRGDEDEGDERRSRLRRNLNRGAE